MKNVLLGLMAVLGVIGIVSAVFTSAASPGRAGPAQARSSCSRASAHAALLAHGLGLNGMVGQVICADFSSDGQIDMAVTEGTPGSAGVIGMAIFVASPNGWIVGLSHPNDYQPTLVSLGDDLLEYVPVFRKGDPNCCPTGGTNDMLYRYTRGHFRVAFAWHQR